MQAILDAETEKLNVLLVEKEQLDKQVAEKEAQDMKELQKMIIELAAFAVKALKHEEQERDENLLIEKLEKKLSILEVKDKAIVDNEEDYLSDNAMVIQVELCQDKIPQFESIFKDPNDFPFLSSLKKTEDDKVVDKSFDLPDKNADEKLMKNNKKRVRKAEQLPSSSSKDSSEILEISKKSSPIESKSPITPVFKSPMISKVASRKQEVSIIDRLPPKKSRKRSIVLDVNDSKPIEDGMQNVESVQESPKRSVVLDSETPCTRVSLDYPVTTRNSIINSSPKVSVNSPVTSKITRQSPTNQANIISVEILPKVGPKLRSQPNLSDTKPRLLSREIIDKSVEESSESILMNVDDDKKTSQETEVIVVSPKEIIWKSPQQKKPLVDKNQTESDSCSEISDNDNLFDDYETSSIKSGNGSEFNFLSPNSDRSFKMNTSENDDAKENKKNAFDFDSFSDSGNFAGGSLF